MTASVARWSCPPFFPPSLPSSFPSLFLLFQYQRKIGELEDHLRDTARERIGLRGGEGPIPRCYFPKHVSIAALQVHGFGDASESAYASVVYLRMVDTNDQVHVALVISKTKVGSDQATHHSQTRAMWSSSSGRSSVSREGAI